MLAFFCVFIVSQLKYKSCQQESGYDIFHYWLSVKTFDFW